MSILKKTPFIEELLSSLTTEQLGTLKTCLNKPTLDASLKLCLEGNETLITSSMAGQIKTCSCRLSKNKVVNGIFIMTETDSVLIGYDNGVFDSDILPVFKFDLTNRSWKAIEELLTADELRRVLDDAKEESGSGTSAHVPNPTASDVRKVLKAVAVGETSWEESGLDIYELPEEPSQAQLREALNHFIIKREYDGSPYYLQKICDFSSTDKMYQVINATNMPKDFWQINIYYDGGDEAYYYDETHDEVRASDIRVGVSILPDQILLGSQTDGFGQPVYRGIDLDHISDEDDIVFNLQDLSEYSLPAGQSNGFAPTEQQLSVCLGSLREFCKRGYLVYSGNVLKLLCCRKTQDSDEDWSYTAAFGFPGASGMGSDQVQHFYYIEINCEQGSTMIVADYWEV